MVAIVGPSPVIDRAALKSALRGCGAPLQVGLLALQARLDLPLACVLASLPVALAAIMPTAWASMLPAAVAAAQPQLAQGPQPQSLEGLDQACTAALGAGDGARLALLQRRLLALYPAPQPLAVVLAQAHALIHCGAPDSALVVLNRYGPSPGAEQLQWLMMQWRAAQAGLDHQLAAAALQQLALVSGQNLEVLELPMAQQTNGRWQPNGRWQTMAAIDVLAGHLDAMGRRDQAAAVLFASRSPGMVSAQRWAQAVAWSPAMPLLEQQRWMDMALEQAAAAGAWGLVAALLDQNLALLAKANAPAALREQAAQRRLRLSRRIDDAYSLNPGAVRSPRAPGGHAAPRPSPAPAPGSPPSSVPVPTP